MVAIGSDLFVTTESKIAIWHVPAAMVMADAGDPTRMQPASGSRLNEVQA